VTSRGKSRREHPYKGDAITGLAEPTRREEGVTFQWYLGIDRGSAEHQFVLLDEAGVVADARVVAHRRDAIQDALLWIQQHTGVAPNAIAVGLEAPHGVLVDVLIDHGYAVFAINPKQVDRFRDRFTAAGAKDDRRDAQAIADGLRTDRRAFQAVQPENPQVLQLRELCRIVEELQEEEGRLANRLREQLYRVDAPWLTLCPAANEAWLWDLLAEVPHPDQWARLPRRRVAPVLRAHRIRRLTADQIVGVLHTPRLLAAPGVADAVETRIGSLVPQLRVVHQQRLTAEQRTDRLLAALAAAPAPEGQPREHRDVEILRSLPGVGRMVTATMLTEAAGAMAARDYSRLRAHVGTAPVTKRSGKRALFVHMRYACKRRLRQAAYHWARTSIQHDVAARAHYEQLRARGHGYARALRSVADRWLRILVAMLRTRTLYDPARFAVVKSHVDTTA
jgi:transposase